LAAIIAVWIGGRSRGRFVPDLSGSPAAHLCRLVVASLSGDSCRKETRYRFCQPLGRLLLPTRTTYRNHRAGSALVSPEWEWTQVLFLQRLLLHYGIYRRYPLRRWSAFKNAWRIAFR